MDTHLVVWCIATGIVCLIVGYLVGYPDGFRDGFFQGKGIKK